MGARKTDEYEMTGESVTAFVGLFSMIHSVVPVAQFASLPNKTSSGATRFFLLKQPTRAARVRRASECLQRAPIASDHRCGTPSFRLWIQARLRP